MTGFQIITHMDASGKPWRIQYASACREGRPVVQFDWFVSDKTWLMSMDGYSTTQCTGRAAIGVMRGVSERLDARAKAGA